MQCVGDVWMVCTGWNPCWWEYTSNIEVFFDGYLYVGYCRI